MEAPKSTVRKLRQRLMVQLLKLASLREGHQKLMADNRALTIAFAKKRGEKTLSVRKPTGFRATGASPSHSYAARKNRTSIHMNKLMAKKAEEKGEKMERKEREDRLPIVKEGNRIVPEWITYHYHVLPMRDLIVCEQPNSREFIEDTPQGTRWSLYSEDPLLNITYVLAGETFYNNDRDKAYLVSEKCKEDGFPLNMQKACYKHCMKEFKERGKVRMRAKSRTKKGG
ncbi:hypothetical protein TrLO_g7669 [Triparma laevis f. longispina]|uniref:Uncharacterized protein n=1 Tax=Triparma laevis f. longispina TaxID=1714387 RepID=A0A9W6ZU61_9STRA|nr:hypothetical protein TrLO_g7669 [Triparma laevis f. longispina]